MTRKTRPEFSKKILLDNLKMLNKDIVITLIAETFIIFIPKLILQQTII